MVTLLFCGPGTPFDHSVLSAPCVGGFATDVIGGGGTVMTGKLPVLPAPAGADWASAAALVIVRASARTRAKGHSFIGDLRLQRRGASSP